MAGPRVEVVDESGSPLASYYQGGRTFVEGDIGARYLLRIAQPDRRRVEAVVSVDGLDAMTGRPGQLRRKRGYFVLGVRRRDRRRVAHARQTRSPTFRFSSVRRLVRGRTGQTVTSGSSASRSLPRAATAPSAAAQAGHRSPRTGRSRAASGRGAAPSSAGRSSADSAPRKSSAGGGVGGGGAAAEPRAAQEYERPGLGTEFGEAHDSSVSEVSFARAESSPSIVTQLWYDDRDGLIARGIPLYPRDDREAETRLRDTAQPFADRFAQPPP